MNVAPHRPRARRRGRHVGDCTWRTRSTPSAVGTSTAKQWWMGSTRRFEAHLRGRRTRAGETRNVSRTSVIMARTDIFRGVEGYGRAIDRAKGASRHPAPTRSSPEAMAGLRRVRWRCARVPLPSRRADPRQTWTGVRARASSFTHQQLADVRRQPRHTSRIAAAHRLRCRDLSAGSTRCVTRAPFDAEVAQACNDSRGRLYESARTTRRTNAFDRRTIYT